MDAEQIEDALLAAKCIEAKARDGERTTGLRLKGRQREAKLG
jgi:hypothetical protein